MPVGEEIDFGERLFAVGAVRRAAALAAEFPAGLAVERIGERNRDDIVELLEAAEDQRAVRPRASQRDVEMIAAGFGGESAFAVRARTAVRRDEIVVGGIGPDKAAVGGARNILLPDAVDEQAHDDLR